MIERYKQKKLTWVDLKNPSKNEIREIALEFEISPDLVADFTHPVPRSLSIGDEKIAKVTMDFPIVKRKDMDGGHEMKFIVAKNFLITARYEDITTIHKYAKEFEVLNLLNKSGKKAHGGHLFISLLSALYDGLAEKLDYLESRMVAIEKEIFNEREKEMVSEISDVARKLITFKQTLSVHEEVLAEAISIFENIFGKSFTAEFEGLYKHYEYLMRRVKTLASVVEELRDTNSALLTTKQNEIMKTLTIMAFITFPLTLFAAVFGMNTSATPIVGSNNDFWIILGWMFAATIVFFAYFKYKRWM